MGKDLTTGVLVTPDMVEWSALSQNKEGTERVAEGGGQIIVGQPSEGDDKTNKLFDGMKSPVILALPSAQVLMRVMNFPLVEDDELEGMVELQVDKFSPFPIDQMVVSHEVLTRSETEMSVLVAAAKEKAIDDAAVVLKQNGHKIQRVDVALLGMWKNILDDGALTQEGRETLVILSGGSIDVLTHEDGVLIAMSCLGAIPDFSDESSLVDISQEVSHLLMGIEVEYGRAPRQKITLWADDINHAFGDALENACGMEVENKSLGVLPSVSHGVAVRGMERSDSNKLLDLTPEVWKSALLAKRSKRHLIVAALSVLLVWCLVVIGGVGWYKFEEIRLKKLEATDAKWATPANRVRKLRLQISMIEKYTDHTHSALECLREISSVQPKGVDLSSFTYRKTEGIDIDGEADSEQLVNQFNESLNKSALFDSVKPGAKIRTKSGRYRFSFDIQFPKEEI